MRLVLVTLMLCGRRRELECQERSGESLIGDTHLILVTRVKDRLFVFGWLYNCREFVIVRGEYI